MTGIAFWMDGFDHRVRSRGQEAIDQVRVGDRLRLGATVALELGAELAKVNRGVIVERKPNHVFFLVCGFGSGAYFAKLFAGTRLVTCGTPARHYRHEP